MASTTDKRRWWDPYRCHEGYIRPGGFFGRSPVYEYPITHEAVSALEKAHLGAGYKPHSNGYIGSKRACPWGIAGARCQPSGAGCSLHNYVIAYDIEYNFNKLSPRYPNRVDPFSPAETPYHVYTREQVSAIENVRNKQGKALFRWLGHIGDYMHWEIDVPPWDVSVDWDTVPGFDAPDIGEGGDIVLQKGDKGLAVAEYQGLMLLWNDAALPGYGKDGDFGGETETWTRHFQTAWDVDPTGKIDGVTADLLRSYENEHVQGVPGPQGPEGPQGPKGDTGEARIPVDVLRRGDTVVLDG